MDNSLHKTSKKKSSSHNIESSGSSTRSFTTCSTSSQMSATTTRTKNHNSSFKTTTTTLAMTKERFESLPTYSTTLAMTRERFESLPTYRQKVDAFFGMLHQLDRVERKQLVLSLLSGSEFPTLVGYPTTLFGTLTSQQRVSLLVFLFNGLDPESRAQCSEELYNSIHSLNLFQCLFFWCLGSGPSLIEDVDPPDSQSNDSSSTSSEPSLLSNTSSSSVTARTFSDEENSDEQPLVSVENENAIPFNSNVPPLDASSSTVNVPTSPVEESKEEEIALVDTEADDRIPSQSNTNSPIFSGLSSSGIVPLAVPTIIETYDRTDDTSSQDNSSISSTATISNASSSDVEHPNVAFNKNGMEMLLPLPERKLSLSDTSSVEA
eukprot:CAMPEP_0170899012 /NCGR_PEP_ID=MMETSP0734-20130129/46396_1 /TAXON_ID=186038 /ORGANISM="Fragilariopsis kerguelensis, Strain L26-C5" /LENGTH=377 /DNA_ID=CAMNT_0011291883 /DNA_START=349 /DNA_END=1482 /DNA_ORIENTATION=-